MADVTITIRAVDRAKRTVGGITDAWAKLSLGLNQTLEVAQKAQEAFDAVYKTLKDAAQIDAAANTFGHLAESIGATSDALTGELRQATGGMVSDIDLMRGASQFLAMGLADTQTEAGKLAEIGTQLGLAFRGDAVGGMEEFALLLANQSIPRLDTFGISAGRVRTRIQELQEQTPGLTRETAFLQAVMEEAEVTMGKVGDQSESTAGKLATLEASAQNVEDAAKQAVAQGLDDLIDSLVLLDEVSREASGGMGLFEQAAIGIQVSQPVRDLTRFTDILTTLTLMQQRGPQSGMGPLGFLRDFDTTYAEVQMRKYGEAVQAVIPPSHGLARAGSFATEALENQAAAAEDAAEATYTAADAYREGRDAFGMGADAAWNAAMAYRTAGEEVNTSADFISDYNERTRIMAERMRAAEAAAGDLFTKQLELGENALFVVNEATGKAAANTDAMADALYKAADAAGASPGELAALGYEAGIFGEEAAMAALKAAAMDAKIRELGQRVAAGMDPADAIQEMQDFAGSLEGVGSQAANARDRIDEVDQRIQNLDGKSATVTVFLNQQGNVSVPGGQAGGPDTDTYSRQEGGPVTAGQQYLVGERGPELFVPRQSGMIINNDLTRQMMGGGGVTVNIQHMSVPASMGADPRAAGMFIGEGIGRSMRG